jgi:hypothetical protein
LDIQQKIKNEVIKHYKFQKSEKKKFLKTIPEYHGTVILPSEIHRLMWRRRL